MYSPVRVFTLMTSPCCTNSGTRTTAPAMLGEGKMLAGFTLIGILFGTYVYGRMHAKEVERG